MYDLIDRPVSDLAPADRRLLAATRAWVHQLTLAGAGTPAAALGDAGETFDAAMRALDRGSRETVVFQRPCHATVSETEALWLAVWRLVRADRIAPARAALGAFVDAGSEPHVLQAMMRVAARI